jgi:hypothetical protein
MIRRLLTKNGMFVNSSLTRQYKVITMNNYYNRLRMASHGGLFFPAQNPYVHRNIFFSHLHAGDCNMSKQSTVTLISCN